MLTNDCSVACCGGQGLLSCTEDDCCHALKTAEIGTACALSAAFLHVCPPLQELTKSMAMFGYDILQALVNDIAPDAKVGV